MLKPGFKLRRADVLDIYAFGQLPKIDKHRYIAVYIRQSNKGADDEHGESRATQLALIEYAKKLVGEDRVLVYDEGAGRSGQLRIDERPKLQKLYADCARGIIGTIIVAREDRLFRDKHGQQVGTFTEMAELQRIILVVPPVGKNNSLRVYDFTKYDHLRAFQDKMKSAYEYIEGHVNYMLENNRNKARRGCYDGRNLPPGLVIARWVEKQDQRPILYEPWAKIMDQQFLKLQRYNWNIYKLMREIELMPYLFPLPTETERKELLFKNNFQKPENGGYKPHYWQTIYRWMENIHLIGWWLVDRHCNEVLIDNHPAVLQRSVFEEGYINLTGFTLEGFPVPQQKTRKTYVYQHRKDPEALLHGKIVTPGGVVNVSRTGYSDKRYLYYIGHGKKTKDSMRQQVFFSIPVSALDSILVQRLEELSEASKDLNMAERIRLHLEEVKEKQQVETLSIDDQLAQIEKNLGKLRKRLIIMSEILEIDPETLEEEDDSDEDNGEQGSDEEEDEIKALRAIGKKIKALSAQKKELLDKRRQLAIIEHHEVEQFYDVLANFRTKFKKLTLEQKQKLIGLLAKNVEVQLLSPHWFQFTIDWTEAIVERPDICVIWRSFMTKKNIDPTPEELAIIKEMYPQHEDMRDLLKKLPHRSWNSICKVAWTHGVKRMIHMERTFPDTVTWLDATVFGEEKLEETVAMASEAESACKGKDKEQQWLLYPFWLFPADATELCEHSDLLGMAQGISAIIERL